MTAAIADNPASLIAILIAARKAGDRDLEREVKRRLQEQHGIRIGFCREQAEAVGK